METVRQASADDLERCAGLLARAGAAGLDERGGDLVARYGAGDGPPPDTATLLARWGSGSPDAALFVGLYDDVVVGIGAATAAGDADVRLGRIECCFVEEAARGVGVGSALLDALVAWCAHAGCTGVDAWALPGDRATKQLYERAGLKARLLVLHRPLG